jgi:hypothetical protein
LHMSSTHRSRSTLATIEAAAMTVQSRSPPITGDAMSTSSLGARFPSTMTWMPLPASGVPAWCKTRRAWVLRKARCIAIIVAHRMLCFKITGSWQKKDSNHTWPLDFIWLSSSYTVSRCDSDSFLESRSSVGRAAPGANTRHAATTGPHTGPRPDSSIPYTYPPGHFSNRSRFSRSSVARSVLDFLLVPVDDSTNAMSSDSDLPSLPSPDVAS